MKLWDGSYVEYNIETMEKSSKGTSRGNSPHQLPALKRTPHSPLHTLNATQTVSTRHSHESLSTLRKLYYRYRSNANIIDKSPYYTNRTQVKQVVAYIKANKHTLTA